MLFVLRSRAQAGAGIMFSCESVSSRMRAKHGAFFAVRLKLYLKAGTVAVVLVIVPGVSRGAVAYPKALVQCRCRCITEARIESRYWNLIASRSGSPG